MIWSILLDVAYADTERSQDVQKKTKKAEIDKILQDTFTSLILRSFRMQCISCKIREALMKQEEYSLVA